MGLERVAKLADSLDLRPAKKPMILVGGTNGKGSVVAMLSAIYAAAGHKVGAYTSPHIAHFCERIRVDGALADESMVVDALAFVEQGRGPDTLTYFEYTTLAAMRVFDVAKCDVLIFEVGLGGRLDATNIWDADCSIVTSIALDHEAYLGSDVSIIATEKAAIGRAGKPFIIGEINPPSSLALYTAAHSFEVINVGAMAPSELPAVAMPGAFQQRNAACAVSAVNALQHIVPVERSIISEALSGVSLDGRFEKMTIDGVTVILDVAHNPAGALALAEAWADEFGDQRCDVVFASLSDKDIAGVVAAIAPIVHTWHCLSLDVPRAMSAQSIADIVRRCVSTSGIDEYDQVSEALHAALAQAKAGGHPVLVAGSFYTIAAVKSVVN